MPPKKAAKKTAKTTKKAGAKSSVKAKDAATLPDVGDLKPFSSGAFPGPDVFPKVLVCVSPSGQSTCKGCLEKIGKGVVRVGVQTGGSDDMGYYTKWYHCSCLKKPKTTKSPEDFIIHYNKAPPLVQRELDDVWAGTVTPAPPKKTAAASKKAQAKKAAAKKAVPVTAAEKNAIKECQEMSVEELKAACKRNGTPCTGLKKDLVSRVAFGMAHGALPRCMECGGGYLHLDPSRSNVFCKGFFDDLDFIRCSYKAPFAEVQTVPWQNS